MTSAPRVGGATLAALVLVTLVPSTAQTMLIPALPQLGRELGAEPDEVAWTITAYLITASVGTPVLGRLGDMFGRRRMQVWALGIFATGSLICVVAGSLAVMVAGRALQGIVGGVFALALGTVRQEYPHEVVGRNIGVLSAVVAIGTSVGFLIGGVLVDVAGVDAVFWFGLATSVVACGWLLGVAPESHRGAGGRVDVRGAALLAVGVTLPLIAFSQANAWGWRSPATLGLIAAGAVVLRAWLAVERRTPLPLVDVRTLAMPTVWLTNLATFLVGCGMFGLFVLTPQLAQADPGAGYGFGLDAAGAGWLLFPGALLMLALGPVSGALGRRVGDRVPLAVGAGTAALGLLALALEHGSIASVVIFATIAGAGIGFAFPAMPNLVVGVVRPSQVGEVAGFNALLRGVGSSVGTQLSAAIVAGSALAGTTSPTDGGYATAYLVAAVAAAGAGLVAFAIPPPVAQRGHVAPLGPAVTRRRSGALASRRRR